MKKIVLILMVFFVSGSTFAFAKTKDLQICLVFSNDEGRYLPNKKYSYVSKPGDSPDQLMVSKDVLLSGADVQGMIVVKKEDTKMKDLPFIDIVFTKEGAKKLEQVTTENLRKRIAVIVGDKILSAPYIIYPMNKGHIFLSHWSVASNNDAAALIKEMGFTPIFKGQVQKTLGK